MKELRLGCYCFRFRRTLDGLKGWQLKKLAAPGGPARNPAFAYVWLRQNGIGFRLSFRWNRSLSWKKNLAQLEQPWMLRKLMDAYDDEVMRFPLDKFINGYENKEEVHESDEH